MGKYTYFGEKWVIYLGNVYSRSLKFTHAHGAHVRGTKASWGDQKAGGPENLLALRAEGTSVELTKQCRGQNNSIIGS